MGVADKLCDELYRWIEEQEKCADHLMALANELENMREVITAGQFVGNTATVVGSAALVGSGIATLLTGGLAAPLVALAAGITAGVGTATSFTCSIVEKWNSSSTMKKAEETGDQIKQIQNNIKMLQKKLQEECESQGFKASFSDDVQCEITVRILKAMAKRSGRDVLLSCLRSLLKSDGMATDMKGLIYTHEEINSPDTSRFFCTVGSLLLLLGYVEISKYYHKTAAKIEGTACSSLINVGKGAGQGAVQGTVQHNNNTIDLVFMTHCWISSPLNLSFREMLKQIPEIEWHIDLAQEMFGSQIYTRGTICIEYKQTQKQDMKRFTRRFILLCTNNIGVTEYGGSTCKDKSGGNKRQKKKATSTEDRKLKPQWKPAFQSEPPQKSKTKVKELRLRLPKILMSNVRSLSNKKEELKELMEDVENFNSDLMFFTETWFNSNSQMNPFKIHMLYRFDRDRRLTGKSRGGGLMMLVKEAWATDVKVENIMITPDYELMVVSIIPHDHPADAPPLIFIHVYVPGPNFTQAAIDIAGFYYDAVEMNPGAPVFLLGDFNRIDFTGLLDLDQYVSCPTRYNKILDKCYGNLPDAYQSECRPPLGKSDHNVIKLNPKNSSEKKDCKHEHNKPRQ
ncbi:Inclusion membrane protein D [Labeo rohita]|uniref:Inclusion membrane protein D n=1 Tax=Labeo rohita TaxID=84645 RepID=A0ABQ8LM71_LABRO|nr:Inclusion membrane protein D [Labeo rohita]